MELKENDLAPDFELPADDGSTVRLSDLRGGRVILYFYPRADTPGCTIEACEFGEALPRIEEKGATVLGVSPDPVGAVRAFREKYDLPFRLLADADHRVAEAYGVWVEKTNFGRTYWGTERTTFVVDEEGRISDIYRRVNAEGHAAAVLQGL
ncbi:MAG TPA: thioredoxin-dependent thiol peroxidase [Longimicrobiaceae bacterium]|nr:thioredoxin-dependent thiol peroxidase [Longimicrobiaceae bacterium]